MNSHGQFTLEVLDIQLTVYLHDLALVSHDRPVTSDAVHQSMGRPVNPHAARVSVPKLLLNTVERRARSQVGGVLFSDKSASDSLSTIVGIQHLHVPTSL